MNDQPQKHYINLNLAICMSILDTSISIAFFFLIAYLFWFQRCRGVYTKTDNRSKFIIGFYFISVAVSGINWNLFLTFQQFYDHFQVERVVEFVDLLTVELAVFNLIVIVFEMQSMKIMLTSRDKQENDRKQKINSILKYFVLITSFISIVVSLIMIFQKYDNQTGFLIISEEDNLYIWIMYIYRNTLFIGISFLFLRLFKFFFIIKKAKLAKEGKQFTAQQKFNTIFVILLVALNTIAFVMRAISPMTNRPQNQEEKLWMDQFDFASMIFFSITDAFTSFGITIFFYQIGKNEYSKQKNGKEHREMEKSQIPLHQQEVWQQRLGHQNFKDSDVDYGGDLSKLCQEQVPYTSEGTYGQMFTKAQVSKVLSEKTTFNQREDNKPSIFQNYKSESDEEEKSNAMFFQQQYLDLDKLIQKTIKIAPPKKFGVKSSNATISSQLSSVQSKIIGLSHQPTSINEVQDEEKDDYYNRNRETIKPPKITQNEEPRSLESKPSSEFLKIDEDDYYASDNRSSDDNLDNVQFKIMRQRRLSGNKILNYFLR